MSARSFPIVGIGASAGGIEALKSFFLGLPADPGIALVIVTHLNPARESILNEVVAHFTALPVAVATDGAQVLVDHVYVMPADAILSIRNGHLAIQKPSEARERKPVDIFLSALAKDQGECAVSVILSGGAMRVTEFLTAIPAIVRETPDDHLLRDALIENLHRSSLNPLEEAAAYQQLLDDFGCTQEELATRIGRSRPQVTNTIRLLRLPPPVARRVAAGVLSAGHARALLSLDDEAAMEALATRIVAEGLSVRATEEIVSIGAAGGKRKERRPRGPRTTPVEVSELVDRASEVLETRITAEVSRTHGRMIVEFASVEDLRRIIDILERPTP